MSKGNNISIDLTASKFTEVVQNRVMRICNIHKTARPEIESEVSATFPQPEYSIQSTPTSP